MFYYDVVKFCTSLTIEQVFLNFGHHVFTVLTCGTCCTAHCSVNIEIPSRWYAVLYSGNLTTVSHIYDRSGK